MPGLVIGSPLSFIGEAEIGATDAAGNITVTPPTASLALATFAPQLRLNVVANVASLTLTTFAPSVTVGVRVVPATLALTISAFAPTVAAPRLVTPSTAALTTSAFAPTVSTPRLLTPITAALTLTGFAPTVTAGDDQPAAPQFITGVNRRLRDEAIRAASEDEANATALLTEWF